MLSPEQKAQRAEYLQAQSEFWLILKTPGGDVLLPFATPHILDIPRSSFSEYPFSRIDIAQFPQSEFNPDNVRAGISRIFDYEENSWILDFMSPDGEYQEHVNTRDYAVYRSQLTFPIEIVIGEGIEPVLGEIVHSDYVAHMRDNLNEITYVDTDNVILLVEDKDGYEDAVDIQQSTPVKILKQGMFHDRRLKQLFHDADWEMVDGGIVAAHADIMWDPERGLTIEWDYGEGVTIPVEYFIRERSSRKYHPLTIPVLYDDVEETGELFPEEEKVVLRRGRVTEKQNW